MIICCQGDWGIFFLFRCAMHNKQRACCYILAENILLGYNYGFSLPKIYKFYIVSNNLFISRNIPFWGVLVPFTSAILRNVCLYVGSDFDYSLKSHPWLVQWLPNHRMRCTRIIILGMVWQWWHLIVPSRRQQFSYMNLNKPHVGELQWEIVPERSVSQFLREAAPHGLVTFRHKNCLLCSGMVLPLPCSEFLTCQIWLTDWRLEV